MQLFHRPFIDWKQQYIKKKKKKLHTCTAVVEIKIKISVILDICEVKMEQSIPIIIRLDVQTEEKWSV